MFTLGYRHETSHRMSMFRRRESAASMQGSDTTQTGTIALHAGYPSDPSAGSVAVSIHQVVARESDIAEHAAALSGLKTEECRRSRVDDAGRYDHRWRALFEPEHWYGAKHDQ